MVLTFLLSFLCNIKLNQLLRPFKSMHLPLLIKSYGRADLQWCSWDCWDLQRPCRAHKCEFWMVSQINPFILNWCYASHPNFQALTAKKAPGHTPLVNTSRGIRKNQRSTKRMWVVLRLEAVNSNLLSCTVWIMTAVFPWWCPTPACIVMLKARKILLYSLAVVRFFWWNTKMKDG